MTVAGHAATLSLDAVQRVDNPGTFNVNLTTGGTRDWAYWASTDNPTSNPMAPTNDKATGGTIISSLSAVGTGGTLRGTSSGATTVGRFTWSGGSGISSGTNVDLPGGLIFNSNLGSAALNQGLSFTIAGVPSVDNYAVIYLGGFGATGRLQLTLNGTTQVVDMSQVFTSTSPKAVVAYQVKFNPDSALDLLTVQYTAINITDNTNGHVGIEGVTVGLSPVIPEPTLALLGGMGSLLLFRRRKIS